GGGGEGGARTATWGVLGMMAWQARMPMRLAGLWRGPRGMHFSMAAMHASSMTQLSEKAMPPWSTRWPTAAISSVEAITPLTGSTMMSSTDWMASLWVGMGISRTTSSRPGTLWVRRPSMPMRSHRPLATTWPPSDSMNWYFREELP